MQSKHIWIIAGTALGIVIIVGTILILRSRDAGPVFYNPFQANQNAIRAEQEVYDPPSDFTSPSIPENREPDLPISSPTSPEPLTWPPSTGY